MNKFVLGALAVSTASALGFAGSKDGEVLSLDRELESLATSLNASAPASTVGVSAFLRTSAFIADKEILGLTDDERGFAIDNARVIVNADAGAGYSLYVSVDAAGGVATLVDAYGKFKITDMVSGTMGQFRAPFLWSGMVDENHLLFNDRLLAGRTLNGAFASLRDTGVMLSGNFEQFGWGASVQNGLDGTLDKQHWSVRGTFNAMGKGVGFQEGAYNSPDELNMTIGVGFADLGEDATGTITDTNVLGGDIVLTKGPLYAHAEVADYDTDIGDNTPWDVTVSYMVSPNQWEVAGRFEDWDTTNNTKHFGVGLGYYVNGFNAKWTLEYDNYNSDNSASPDGNAISLTLTVGA